MIVTILQIKKILCNFKNEEYTLFLKELSSDKKKIKLSKLSNFTPSFNVRKKKYDAAYLKYSFCFIIQNKEEVS